MHRKYAKDGLVVMTVSVDAPDQLAAALAFLRKTEATIPNYLLNEEPEFWQKKLKISGPPIAFVFDREGKRAAKFDNDTREEAYTHEDIEKVVKELLQAKP